MVQLVEKAASNSDITSTKDITNAYSVPCEINGKYIYICVYIYLIYLLIDVLIYFNILPTLFHSIDKCLYLCQYLFNIQSIYISV
jgi:hypothetical protein